MYMTEKTPWYLKTSRIIAVSLIGALFGLCIAS